MNACRAGSGAAPYGAIRAPDGCGGRVIEDTGPGLECARRVCEAPLGAWPNSRHFEPPHRQFPDVAAPDEFATTAARWVEDGARVVGGCCGLGPEHIRALAERLRD